MIIKLPHIEAIDTLNLSEDFDEKVKYSFQKFTEETNKDYVDEDKLLFLDRLRTSYVGLLNAGAEMEDILSENIVTQIEDGDFPDKSEYFCFEYMVYCYERGRNDSNFRRKNYEKYDSKNKETIKVIAQIIRIVMNWSWDDVAKNND